MLLYHAKNIYTGEDDTFSIVPVDIYDTFSIVEKVCVELTILLYHAERYVSENFDTFSIVPVDIYDYF